MIQVDVDPPVVNNIQVVSEPLEEPNSYIKIYHKPEGSGGIKYCIIVLDREHRSTKSP